MPDYLAVAPVRDWGLIGWTNVDTPQTINATTEATANSTSYGMNIPTKYIDQNIQLRFVVFIPAWKPSVSGTRLTLLCVQIEGATTSLGQMLAAFSSTSGNDDGPLYGECSIGNDIRLTKPPGAQTIVQVRGFLSGNTATLSAGTGGTGNYSPGYFGAYWAPTSSFLTPS